MNVAALVVCLLSAAVVPLTDDQRTALATAFDGRDHREAAFAALLENVGQWTLGLGDAAVRLHPDLGAMHAKPEAYRGELFRIVGDIQQQTPLQYPYDSVVEWFIRDEAGRPILVYVNNLAPDDVFDDGERVMILARFYKRIDAVARDGEVHQYSAFVGAFPSRLSAGDDAWGRLWMVTVPVVVMFMVFVLLMVYARRGRRARSRFHLGRTVQGAGAATGAELDEQPPLPDDPARALAEMRRRAEAAER